MVDSRKRDSNVTTIDPPEVTPSSSTSDRGASDGPRLDSPLASITETPTQKWKPMPRYVLRKRNLLHHVRKVLPELETFVDIGCGAGDLACSLAELGLRGIGYDFSPDAIRTANAIREERKLAEEQVRFVQSDTTLDEMTEQFDLVVCNEVLEHIEDDRAAFANLVRLAKKYLIISVPAKKKLFSASDELAGHYRRYDRPDLTELVSHPDVRVLHIVSYGYPFIYAARYFRERLARKQIAATRSDEEMAALTKQSGIHSSHLPGRLARIVQRIDATIGLEALMAPPYHISRLFNRCDLSEGYLVVLQITR
ncbi:MAG: methyltransferase domain-containing protein [Planctomycetes bacterium]|nr:methyltransferase domain-containing protein [Planctomycetota bacterium]MCB9891075.1 methyltransferase domain-containing protein [Planctomycetota bacterium]MCB9916964.1 methyltransferase domain-containing protein [Planctomycetota bacterium]